MATATQYEHVRLNERGEPVIGPSQFKLLLLVTEHLEYGWSAEELHFQHPHLSLGQIHSALAYYWDHQANLDALIAQHRQKAEELLTYPETPLVARLRRTKRDQP